MNKLLLSAAMLFSSFAFGQITLEYSFPTDENVYAYTKGDTMFYVSTTANKLKIYNADYSLQKVINVPLPANYRLSFYGNIDAGNPFPISRHIFNTDDKYEFIILAISNESSHTKLLLINEDGQLIKDFHPFAGEGREDGYEVFHDPTVNKNKLIVYKWINGSYDRQAEVYSLPTSALTTKEIQFKNRLSAFPVPASKSLNIYNPRNNSSRVEVFDTTGRLLMSKSFNINENTISINVENLPKGNYIYRIGDQTSKFIKE